MREAHSLRASGHDVTVIGIPEGNATDPLEKLADGVTVERVDWYPPARRRLVKSAIPRAVLFVAVVAALAFGAFRLTVLLLDSGRPAPLPALLATAGVIAMGGLIWLGISAALARRSRANDMLRRRMISGDAVAGRFPPIRSRIPNWVPDWLLEVAVEPLGWFGGPAAKFSMYRYRSQELAAAAISKNPDIVHCHDCIALPTGWLVKQALGIPLVYDAHEIYEAVAARRFGATDYFARVHSRYLPRVDAFIAVNDSAAAYYRLAYPTAVPAAVIRNATDSPMPSAYDGCLHRAAGLPETERILLYQGGFTAHRGLETLVGAGALLPDGWSLVMMGWGPLQAELERKAAAEAHGGAPSKVRFVPAVPAAELLAWTQGATAGIVPYEDKMLNHWIATPNKLWEYPGASVPLIVQPFPEMCRIVETYGCGWVLPPEFSPAAIASLVDSLTDEMIAQAREGCRRFVAADNWAVYEQRLLALYASLEKRVQASRRRSAA
ncbi:MAG TPA: glycosyltransferase [Rhizomicrobium sp.]|nr:glycosyltransferase [Rhizomicrobium sp.]